MDNNRAKVNEINLPDLITRAKEWDQQAMTDLYAIGMKQAKYTASTYIKDDAQAEDIVQDSFVKAFASLDSLTDPEKFQSWLNTIVANKCKDYLKKNKPVLFSELTTTDDEGEDVEPEFEDRNIAFTPEANMDQQATQKIVQEMINELPADQRVAVTLFYKDELSIKDIAQTMECSEGTVKSRLSRAKDKIKQMTLDIEKRDGIKLHAIPVAALLGWFFKSQTSSVTAYAMEGTAGSVGNISAAQAAAKTAATGAAAAKTAAAGTAVKLIAGIAAAAVVAGGAAGVIAHKAGSSAAGNAETSSVISGTASAGAGTETVTEAGLTDEQLSLLKELYTYVDEANNTDRYLYDTYLQNREALYELYDALPDKNVIFTGEKFEKTDTGVGVYLKSHRELYVGELKNGLPDGYGSLSRWVWFYAFQTEGEYDNDNYYMALVPLVEGKSYSGLWSQGKANGEGSYGVASQVYFDEDKVSHSIDDNSEENSRVYLAYASDYVNDVANNIVYYELPYINTRYEIPVNDGYVDDSRLSSDVGITNSSSSTNYEFHDLNGSDHKHKVSSYRQFKNNCTWEDTGIKYDALWPDIQPVECEAMKTAYIEGLTDATYEIFDNIEDKFGYESVFDFFRQLVEKCGGAFADSSSDSYIFTEYTEADDSVTITFKDEYDEYITSFTYYADGTSETDYRPDASQTQQEQHAATPYRDILKGLNAVQIEELEIYSDNAVVTDMGDYYEVSNITVQVPDTFNFSDIADDWSVTVAGKKYGIDLNSEQDMGEGAYYYDTTDAEYFGMYRYASGICELMTSSDIVLKKTLDIDKIYVSKDCLVYLSTGEDVAFAEYCSTDRSSYGGEQWLQQSGFNVYNKGTLYLQAGMQFDNGGYINKITEWVYS